MRLKMYLICKLIIGSSKNLDQNTFAIDKYVHSHQVQQNIS